MKKINEAFAPRPVQAGVYWHHKGGVYTVLFLADGPLPAVTPRGKRPRGMRAGMAVQVILNLTLGRVVIVRADAVLDKSRDRQLIPRAQLSSNLPRGAWESVVYVSHSTGRVLGRDRHEFIASVTWPDGKFQPRFIPVPRAELRQWDALARKGYIPSLASPRLRTRRPK